MHATLLVIGSSHYCEKSRWSLQKAGISFAEEGHAPFFHIRPVRAAGGTRTTPVLVAEDGVYGDSVDISGWIQSHPQASWRPYGDRPEHRAEIERIERELGRKMGVLTRILMYQEMLPHKAIVLRSLAHQTPPHEVEWVRRLYPVFSMLIRRGLGVSAHSAQRAHDAILGIFEEVERQAAGEFLVGDTLSIADITLAALAAPVLLPEQYGASSLPMLTELPGHVQDTIGRFRQTACGQRALRLYATHR